MTEWQVSAALLLKLLIDLSLKGGLLLLVAVLTVRALRRGSADQRYTTLTLVFHGLLLLPLLLPVHPLWKVPLLPLKWTAGLSPLSFGFAPPVPVYGPLVLILLWCAGFLWVLGRLARGLFGVSTLRRSARPLYDSGWQRQLHEVARQVGVRRPVQLLEHPSLSTALAVGLRHPAIVVPAAARRWSADRRKAILTHEMIHHRRRDNLTNLVVHAVCALHWFNPLVWWAARQLRADRERACDDAVLLNGTRPSDYVESLLSFVPRPRPLPRSVEMGQASSLKARLRAILDPRQRRTPVGWLRSLSHLAAVIALVACLALLDVWLPPELTGEVSNPFQIVTRFTSAGHSDFAREAGPGSVDSEMARVGKPAAPDRTVAPTVWSHDSGVADAGRPTGSPTSRWRVENPAADALTVAAAGRPRSGYFLRGPLSAAPTLPDPAEGTPAGSATDRGRQVVNQIDLGTLGGDSAAAAALNEAGQVVGSSTNAEGARLPFVWSPDTGMQPIELPPTITAAGAVAINDRGEVLVQSSDVTGSLSSFLWSPELGVRPIGALGDQRTEGLVINNQGRVAGRVEVAPGRQRAFTWSPDDGFFNLGGHEAIAINDRGLVIARADSFSYAWREDLGFVRIGDVGVRAIPFDVNNLGQVVGSATTVDNSRPHAFLWSVEDGFTDLGELLGGDQESVAYQINDAGQVLGVTRNGVPLAATAPVGQVETAFLWSPEQGLIVLEAQVVPGVVLNNLGQLVGRLPIPIATSKASALFWSRELGSIRLLRDDLEAEVRAEPVALNDRGQVVGNLLSPDRSRSRALLWELQLPDSPR